MSNLDELQSSLLSLLGDEDNTDGWSAATTEEAIRLALAEYIRMGPIVERTVVIDEDEYSIVISSYNVAEVFALAYPWVDGQVFEEQMIPFRVTSTTTIRSDTVEFEEGERIRWRCRPIYRIEDLDGEDSTDLSEDQEPIMLLCAAHHAYLLRVRQLAHLPSSPPVEIETYENLAGEYWGKFKEALTAPPLASISWSNIGL